LDAEQQRRAADAAARAGADAAAIEREMDLKQQLAEASARLDALQGGAAADSARLKDQLAQLAQSQQQAQQQAVAAEAKAAELEARVAAAVRRSGELETIRGQLEAEVSLLQAQVGDAETTAQKERARADKVEASMAARLAPGGELELQQEAAIYEAMQGLQVRLAGWVARSGGSGGGVGLVGLRSIWLAVRCCRRHRLFLHRRRRLIFRRRRRHRLVLVRRRLHRLVLLRVVVSWLSSPPSSLSPISLSYSAFRCRWSCSCHCGSRHALPPTSTPHSELPPQRYLHIPFSFSNDPITGGL
jgi:hypothetical protein